MDMHTAHQPCLRAESPIMARRVVSSPVCFTLAALLTLATPAAHSHHPIGAKFDETQVVTLSGRVTAVAWANPNVHVFFNVRQADGSDINWAAELPSTYEL